MPSLPPRNVAQRLTFSWFDGMSHPVEANVRSPMAETPIQPVQFDSGEEKVRILEISGRDSSSTDSDSSDTPTFALKVNDSLRCRSCRSAKSVVRCGDRYIIVAVRSMPRGARRGEGAARDGNASHQ